MNKQEKLEAWLTNELKEWLEDIVGAYKDTGDRVATSPKVVARLILLELDKRGVRMKVTIKDGSPSPEVSPVVSILGW